MTRFCFWLAALPLTIFISSCGGDSSSSPKAGPSPAPAASVARYLYVASPYGAPTNSVLVCALSPFDGSIQSCQNAGGSPNLDGSNPQGIALNNTGSGAYITNGSGTSDVYQCTINSTDGTFSGCALPLPISTTNGYVSGYGMVAVNQQNTIAYIVNNLTSSPGVVTCNIAAGVINPSCFDAGATNMMDSGEGIALNRAGTVAYIADYSMGLFVCSVNGLSVQTSCNLINTVGSVTIQGPAGVALNPSESLVYVADYRSDAIYACDTGFTSCFVANQNILHPASISINATGTSAYVTNFGSDVYHCSILSNGTFANCTSTSPAGLSVAVGTALGY